MYATTGYTSNISNLAKTSLTSGKVFSDGPTTQLATVTGDVTNGCVVPRTGGLTVAVYVHELASVSMVQRPRNAENSWMKRRNKRKETRRSTGQT